MDQKTYFSTKAALLAIGEAVQQIPLLEFVAVAHQLATMPEIAAEVFDVQDAPTEALVFLAVHLHELQRKIADADMGALARNEPTSVARPGKSA